MQSSDVSDSLPVESAGQISDRIRDRIAPLYILPHRSLDLCFIGIFLLTAIYLILWPIVAFDTDLWSHLNGGRYLVDHGKIPRTNFYSFVSPEREIISYSWLFKALIYQIFLYFSYHGLIIFRTLVCAATLTVVFLFLRNRQARTGTAAIFVLYFMLFVDSGAGIRPYNFSYFFIALFLFIIEHRPQKAYLLPALAIVWINFHGIEYPVMILIVLCYLGAYFRNRWQQDTQIGPQNYRYLISLALCMATLFASPYGIDLLRVPFTETTYASIYIDELRPFVFDDFLRFNLSGLAPDFKTVSNLLIFSILAVTATRICRRQISLHHLVLLAGGLYLLTKGMRFIHEFVLLSLPGLAAVDRKTQTETKQSPQSLVPISAAIALLTISCFYINNLYGNRPKYPVTRAGLPIGVTNFMHHVKAKGRILNDPATGGYLGWRMWPDCLIYMDMQVPFFFTDRDFYQGINAIYNKEAFRHFRRRYEPDFLSLPTRSPLNKEPVIRSEGYVPVFFDDQEILYVHREKYPDIAGEHQLNIINPAVNRQISFGEMSNKDKQAFLTEAQRLVSIYPQSLTVNRLLSLYFAEQKDFTRAIEYAQQVIDYFPNHAEGYIRKAAALKEIKAYTKALRTYRQALRRTEKNRRTELYKAMGECYFALQHYRKAYRYFMKSENFFSPPVGYFDLYQLALSAYQAGKHDEARMWAEFIAVKLPEKKSARDPRIDKLLQALEIKPQ